jgi:hypothetical protein
LVDVADVESLYRQLDELALMCRRTVHDANNAITALMLRIDIAGREQRIGSEHLAALREGFASLSKALAQLDSATARWCDVSVTT